MQKFNITQGMSVWLRRLGNIGRQNVLYHGTIASIEPHYFRVNFQWSPVCGRSAKFCMEDFECVPNERGEVYQIYSTVTDCLRDAQALEKAQAIQEALRVGMMNVEREQRPSSELIDQIYVLLTSNGFALEWPFYPKYYDAAGNEICEEMENLHHE